jgi:hypothetical protein
MGSGRTAINSLEPSVGAETGSPTLSQPASVVSGRPRTTIKSFLLAQTASRATLYITDWQPKSD